LVQDHKVVILQLGVGTLKVVVQELEKLVMLLREVREVDEEATAHVPFHSLYCFWPCWPIVLHQQVAVFQQTSPTDFFRVFRGDQLFV
jgi:hypothetical protein